MRPPDPSTVTPATRSLYEHDIREMWDRSLAPHVWNQYRNQLETYIRIAGPPSREVLDVGCAQGTLALLLAEAGHEVTAVDIRPDYLAYAESRYSHGKVRFIAADVLTDSIPGMYDLIFANQIIEHTTRPRELIGRLVTSLRPGGVLVISTPNGEYLRSSLPTYADLSGELADWGPENTADGADHFFAFTREELSMLVRDAGLEILNWQYFESPFICGHMLIRYLHRVIPYRILSTCDRILLRTRWAAQVAHQVLIKALRPIPGSHRR